MSTLKQNLNEKMFNIWRKNLINGTYLKKGDVNSIICMDFFYSSESIWEREGHLG